MYRALATLAFAAGALSAPLAATAQDRYPEKPVRIVVPFPAGSAPDVVARVLADDYGNAWKQPVLVENVPGAAGSVAAERVARAPADGYTLLLSGDAAMTTNVALYEKLAYAPLRDFAPISLVVETPNVLVVHPDVPARSVQELVALAKSQPGKLTYASAGSGTSQHLAGELFNRAAGVAVTHVPYKGPQAVQDVMAGRVTMVFGNVVTTLPQVRDGRLRALAVTSNARVELVPDLPTMAEAGLPDVDAIAWFGLLAPAGTPPAIVRAVHERTIAALGNPQLRAKLVSTGMIVVGNDPAAFAKRIEIEIARKGALVRAIGAKAD
jgi:tripartite-type tricarboxylate transporter receptor subunit TctC